MLLDVFRFELQYRATRAATYLYFGILFLLAFFATATDAVQLSGAVGNIHRNSPLVLLQLQAALSAFGLMITAAIMSVAVFRDYEHNFHTVLFSYPINKREYIWGRFLGSLATAIFVFLAVPLGSLAGIIVSQLLGFYSAEKFGIFSLEAYLQPFILIVLPNLFFTGAVFFSLVTITKNILYSYVGSVALLVIYLVSGIILSDIDNRRISGVLDPFGLQTISTITRYWTPDEVNSLLIPLDVELIANRIIWILVGGVLLFITYQRFEFITITERGKTKSSKQITEEKFQLPATAQMELPLATQVFSFLKDLRNVFVLGIQECKNIVFDIPFISLLLLGVFVFGINAAFIGQIFGTKTWPVTYQVIGITEGSFALFILIIITFYAGELIWRERTVRIHLIMDALPVPDWLYFVSKIIGLFLVVAVLQLCMLLCGIIVQILNGYYKFELDQAFITYFLIRLPSWCNLCMLALAAQVLVNQKFIGHLVMVVYYILNITLNVLEYNHNIYNFNDSPTIIYSDMNGYGHFWIGYFYFKFYWSIFAIFLVCLALLFWVRGTESDLKNRLVIAQNRFNGRLRTAIITLVILFIVMGGYIYYNTNVLNIYRTPAEERKLIASYEKNYKRYEKLLQPRITDVFIRLDLFPYQLSADISGHYILKNKTPYPIDTLIIGYNEITKVRNLKPITDFSIVLNDSLLGFQVLKLNKPLLPNDTCKLQFDLNLVQKGFPNDYSFRSLVYNGTFLSNSILPRIGYSAEGELSDPEQRKKAGLPPKPRMPAIDDVTARNNNYVSSDADWINFEAIISTEKDQIAIAPGYLQKEWVENDRKYFHYKMDSPILNFYSFLSAKYAVAKDIWKNPVPPYPADSNHKFANRGDVAIEIYYHPGHEYNVNKMIEAVKGSLDYLTQNYSPYQHKQMRIIEFPRYATFAQSFPNTVPYSESIGFIARVADPEEDIDYVYFVTSHEVAHQWWAHQVVGANCQGSTLMSESMAEYTALRIMEKKYGKQLMRKFLKYELDGYLRGRLTEPQKENPLILNENQQYIHYQKGALVLYALSDYVGEKQMNQAIQKYLEAVAFQNPPYTTSKEFVSYLRDATPDSLKYLITDLFEKITLYDNRTEEATVEKQSDNKYKVTLKVHSQKFSADSIGKQTEEPLQDYIDIGVFGQRTVSKLGASGKPLYLKRHKITKNQTTIEIIVDELPYEAGIDPFNKLIDRDSDDNLKKL